MQKVISFGYFTLVARYIGVENTGQYFFAITFTTIFSVVADLGLASVLTRETARHPENSNKFINTVFWTKVFFGICAYAVAIFFVNVLQYPDSIKVLVYLSGVTMFFDNLHSSFYSIFRARKNLVYESVGIVGSQFVTLIIGTVAMFSGWPLVWLIAAYTIPSFLNFIYSAYFARRVYDLHYGFNWDRKILKNFLVFAAPFAVAGLLGKLYSYSDSLIMSKMLTSQELGWWSVPYKITFAFQFIPLALSASVYPVMSNLFMEDKGKIAALFEKSWRYLFIIIFPLSFGLFVLAEPIILKLYRADYIASVPVLQVLVISLIFGFLSFITGALLNATNKQKTQTGLMAVSLAVNIAINILLLPRWGIMGAAAAALSSNIVLCFGGLYFASREVPMRFVMLFKFANQSFWPAVIMAFVVYYLERKMNFILTVPIGALIYGLLLFMTGVINKNMIKEVLGKIFKFEPEPQIKL